MAATKLDALTKFRAENIKAPTGVMWVLASSGDPKQKMQVDVLSGLIRQDVAHIDLYGASMSRDAMEKALPNALKDLENYPTDLAIGKVELYGTPAADRLLFLVIEKRADQAWDRSRFEYLPMQLGMFALASSMTNKRVLMDPHGQSYYSVIRTATPADLDSYHCEWSC